jgi:hypothetical protein
MSALHQVLSGLHRVVGDVQLVAIGHVLSQDQRDSIDQLLQGRRSHGPYPHPTVLGADDSLTPPAEFSESALIVCVPTTKGPPAHGGLALSPG